MKDLKIAFVYYKGGTGKATSCLNVAGWLVKMNKKVLVIDLDLQGDAATGLGIDKATCGNSSYDVMFIRKKLQEVIVETLKTLLIDINIKLEVEINIMMVIMRKFVPMLFDMIPTFEISKLAKEFLLENNIPQLEKFLVPFSRKIYNAQKKGFPISHYTPGSEPGRAYKRNTKEIINVSHISGKGHGKPIENTGKKGIVWR
jgi:MinD-like ATPase involved in chromosome partitioning or flagellar assembly